MVLVHFPRDQCVLTPNRALNRTQFSQAKVENIRVATFCHKDVRRFDVTVDYAFRMCSIQSVCNINPNSQVATLNAAGFRHQSGKALGNAL